jgi:thiopeptide-type bacteriocin biosynthesis protein
MKNKKRTFIPGSEWIYFKVYTGIKTAEKIINTELYDIVRELKKNDLIDKWFFIRYTDPSFHLRIRFLSKNKKDIGEIILIFNDKIKHLVESNLVWKVQLDTYNREIERYNEQFIDYAESIFYVDSDCQLSLIRSIEKYKNEQYRWMISLLLIDSYLSLFRFKIKEKKSFLLILDELHKKEFGFNEFNAKSFNTMFRNNKSILESVMYAKVDDQNFNTMVKYVKDSSERMRPEIDKIYFKMKRGKMNLFPVLSSLIHMSLNRLFIEKNRTYELVLYDYMRRFYSSEFVKSNKINS